MKSIKSFIARISRASLYTRSTHQSVLLPLPHPGSTESPPPPPASNHEPLQQPVPKQHGPHHHHPPLLPNTPPIPKHLQRGASTLQKIIYMYRAQTLQYPITQILKSDNGNQLSVYLDEEKLESLNLKLGIFPLPAQLEIGGEREREALLAMIFCVECVGWMHEIVPYFFPVETGIQETSTSPPQNSPLELVIIHSPSDPPRRTSEMQHELFLLTLPSSSSRSAEKYALDLTSAQYGYSHPLTPWNEYLSSRSLQHSAPRPLGTWNRILRQLNAKRPERRDMRNHAVLALFLREEVQKWERMEGRSVREMMMVGPSGELEFAKWEERFLRYLTERMGWYVEALRLALED